LEGGWELEIRLEKEYKTEALATRTPLFFFFFFFAAALLTKPAVGGKKERGESFSGESTQPPSTTKWPWP
jgi:hypothetical protein